MGQRQHASVHHLAAVDVTRRRARQITKIVNRARPRRVLEQSIARDREERELKRAVQQTARLTDLARKLKRAIRGADTALSGLSTLLVEREVRRLATIATDEAPRG